MTADAPPVTEEERSMLIVAAADGIDELLWAIERVKADAYQAGLTAGRKRGPV